MAQKRVAMLYFATRGPSLQTFIQQFADGDDAIVDYLVTCSEITRLLIDLIPAQTIASTWTRVTCKATVISDTWLAFLQVTMYH
jgi:hypothetical protein